MKDSLTALLAMTLLAGTFLAGGCTNCDSQVNPLKMTIAKLNTQLKLSQDDLTAARQENEQLSQSAASAQQRADAALQSHALLQQQYTKLDSTYKTLRDAYADITTQQPDVPKLGSVTVLPADVNDALEAFARENPGLMEFDAKFGMVKFKSDLTFKPGSDFVQADAKKALERFVQILNSPSAAGFNVYVAGHTDDMRIVKADTLRRHPNNWYLSVHRAVAVQQVLEAAGLNPERLGVLGFSQYHPITPNKANHGGNESNRRVEIWIVPQGRYLTQN